MQITVDEEAARQATYDSLIAKKYQLHWIPEFIDLALRRSGQSVAAIIDSPEFIADCERTRKSAYPRIGSTITKDVLVEAPFHEGQPLLGAFISRELTRASRSLKTNFGKESAECESLLRQQFIKQNEGYAVAGTRDGSRVAFSYLHYNRAFIRGAWESIKVLLYHKKRFPSISEVVHLPDDAAIDPWEYYRLPKEHRHDGENPEFAATVLSAIERTLDSSVHSQELRLMLGGVRTPAQVAASLGHPESWLSMLVTQPFFRAIQKELRLAGVEYRAGGKVDMRRVRARLMELMDSPINAGDSHLSLPSPAKFQTNPENATPLTK